MSTDAPMTLEEKKRRIQELMASKSRAGAAASYRDYTYDMFMGSMGAEVAEITRFNEWVEAAKQDGVYAFESPRLTGQQPEVIVARETGPGACRNARVHRARRRAWNETASAHARGRRNANVSSSCHHHGTAAQRNTR